MSAVLFRETSHGGSVGRDSESATIVLTATNARDAYAATDKIMELEVDYDLEITIRKTLKRKTGRNIAPATSVEIS